MGHTTPVTVARPQAPGRNRRAARLRDAIGRHRLDVALVVLFVVVVAPFVPELTAQGGARYSLTAAIVEQRTIVLDDYEATLGVDRVERGGHVYSDKAPGQPLLGVPVLAAAEALGVPSGTDQDQFENLGAWSQIVVFCTIPGALLLVVMRRHARRTLPAGTALAGALGLSFTTMLLPLSSTLYSHVFVALLVFTAWHIVSRQTIEPRHAFVAGTLGAIAVVSEYPAAYTIAVLGLWVLVHHRLAHAVRFGIPVVCALPLLVAHNRLAYDSVATGYTAKSGGGRLNWVRLPDPVTVYKIFFGNKGFVFTPIVIVGLVFLVRGLWRGRRDFLVPAAVFGGFLVLQGGWGNPWGGEGPGPRYIAAAVPFLVVPVAYALSRMARPLRATVVGVGALSMSLVVITFELVPRGFPLVESHLRWLSGAKGLNPTIFTMAIGPAGWIVHLALIALAIRGLVRARPAGTAAI